MNKCTGCNKCKSCLALKRKERYFREKLEPDPTKVCATCMVEKPIDQFTKNQYNEDGIHNHCRECKRFAEYPAEIKRRYNITIEEYQTMAENQFGLCAICRTPKKLFVDHCHKTGKVRGLLCRECNSLIGFADDDEERLSTAIYYLIRGREP